MADGGRWPKAVFYDSKDTLFDWGTQWREASAAVSRKRGGGADPSEFFATWKRHLNALNALHAFTDYRDFTELLRESLVVAMKVHGIDGSGADVAEMVDRWDAVQPFPGVPEALVEQQKHCKILIFSNLETKYLRMMAGKVTTASGFTPDYLGTMEDARLCKPSPRAYRDVLARNALRPEDVLYCTGPQWDVQGGMAFGMKGVWINWQGESRTGHPYDHEAADIAGVTEVVRSYASGETPGCAVGPRPASLQAG